jgi:16S rRNA (uracil1498-N3)-methyltransferase
MRVVACTLDAATPLARLDPPPRPGERIALCIGPEGGFDPADLDVLRRAGAEEAHLGPRVLRARLAGVVALSTLLASAGELDTPVAGWPEEAAAR